MKKKKKKKIITKVHHKWGGGHDGGFVTLSPCFFNESFPLCLVAAPPSPISHIVIPSPNGKILITYCCFCFCIGQRLNKGQPDTD